MPDEYPESIKYKIAKLAQADGLDIGSLDASAWRHYAIKAKVNDSPLTLVNDGISLASARTRKFFGMSLPQVRVQGNELLCKNCPYDAYTELVDAVACGECGCSAKDLALKQSDVYTHCPRLVWDNKLSVEAQIKKLLGLAQRDKLKKEVVDAYVKLFQE